MTEANSGNDNRAYPTQAADEQPDLPVAGIGASAGGIKALQEFFAPLPEKTGLAFVVIVHLAPEHRSELPHILATRTSMPVVQVGDPVPLEADYLYVTPPDRRLEIGDNKIAARAFETPRGQRAPIDLFFRSLAEQRGDGFAVIMTGAGSDGTMGLKAVKDRSLRMFARRTGHDFSRYKRSTIQRRITWRAQVNKMENFADYFTFLRENVEEVQAIFADPLISVTTFFRDLKAFDALAGEVVPKLFEGRGADDPIRVWVPGCATNERGRLLDRHPAPRGSEHL
jgi:hypothetical protein